MARCGFADRAHLPQILRGREHRVRSVWMSVPHVDVRASRRKSCDVCRCAVVWLGRMEATLRECEVVAAGTERVLGDDASQLVPCNPLQGGFAVLEHTGRKPCVLAVEDPDLRQVDLGVGSVLAHAKKVSQLARRSSAKASSSATRAIAPTLLRSVFRHAYATKATPAASADRRRCGVRTCRRAR